MAEIYLCDDKIHAAGKAKFLIDKGWIVSIFGPFDATKVSQRVSGTTTRVSVNSGAANYVIVAYMNTDAGGEAEED